MQSRFLKVAEAKPVSADEFKALLEAAWNKIRSKTKGSLHSSKVALAVSGGPDSTALAALAADVLGKENLIACVVDHRLEAIGVRDEPAKAVSMLTGLGIRSEVVNVDWPPSSKLFSTASESGIVKGKMMVEAREQRYRTLLSAIKRHHASLLLTGHNFEDDLVTMFYRMSRLSGLDGVAGMKLATTFPFPVHHNDEHFILRPLLSVPKARLLATCQQRGLPCVHDPSNLDLNYRRNETLEGLLQIQEHNPEITVDRLQKLIQNLKAHRAHLHRQGLSAKPQAID